MLFDQLFDSLERRFGQSTDFTDFQENPVRFGQEVLGETFTDDVKRMMQSVRDNPITVAMSANATGKTHGAARVAAWFYLAFPSSQVYTAAAPPEANLRRLLWGEIHSVTELHPDIFKGHTVNALSIERGAQSFITGVTIPLSGSEAIREAKFSGKHAPHLLFIIDEGDAVPDEVYRGIESCMSGGHARLLCMFNPRHEAGSVYRMVRDGKANVVHLSAFNHPNVVTGEDRIPGAVTREVTVRRINEWCRPLPSREKVSDGCFELPDFLVGATAVSQNGTEYPPLQAGHYRVTEPSFSYMVLGQYPTQASTQLISREWISAARVRWDAYVMENGETPPHPGGIMGLDVAEYGNDANVAICRYSGFVERPIVWSGIDIIATADRASEIMKEKGLTRCNADATGVGSGVAPQMQRNGCTARAVKVAEKPTERTEIGDFALLRDQLWWKTREWLRADPGAMLPPDEMLIEELLTPTYEVINGKVRVMDKKSMKELLKRSPDRADALCLTFAPGGFFANCDLS